MNDIIKLAVDTYKGVKTAYAEGDPNEIIKNALVEANGGSSKISYKAMRDGKCAGLFALVEEMIDKTVVEGLPESSPIFKFVDYKNGALGDKPEFVVNDTSLLSVATITAGTQGIRRQRVMGGSTVTLTPEVKAIKIYEELNLILAGRIDWIEFVNRVSKSFVADINSDIATAFKGLYSKVVSPYQVTGSFSEDSLVTLIEHVEAATGMTAKIIATRTALRKINMSVSGDEVKTDYYNFGFAGKFNGTECFALKNGHAVGGTSFILNDTDVYVVAGDDKFIKFYTEGETTVMVGDPTSNADLTQEFTTITKNAVAIALAEELGVYRIS